ncbi:hypothetical protein D3C72_981090 [compost metagenome]
MPTARLLIARFAEPPAPNGTLPMGVPLSMKVTDPVAVALLSVALLSAATVLLGLAATVALKLRGWPTMTGLGVAASVSRVGAWATAEQDTAMFVTFAPLTVPLPWATVHVCAGDVGCASTVTA